MGGRCCAPSCCCSAAASHFQADADVACPRCLHPYLSSCELRPMSCPRPCRSASSGSWLHSSTRRFSRTPSLPHRQGGRGAAVVSGVGVQRTVQAAGMRSCGSGLRQLVAACGPVGPGYAVLTCSAALAMHRVCLLQKKQQEDAERRARMANEAAAQEAERRDRGRERARRRSRSRSPRSDRRRSERSRSRERERERDSRRRSRSRSHSRDRQHRRYWLACLPGVSEPPGRGSVRGGRVNNQVGLVAEKARGMRLLAPANGLFSGLCFACCCCGGLLGTCPPCLAWLCVPAAAMRSWLLLTS